MLSGIKLKLGRYLANYLDQSLRDYRHFSTNSTPVLAKWLKPGDVLLVEGNKRISEAVKYLTQSTWSHAAFYAGDAIGKSINDEPCQLIEAELKHGVVASPLSKYRNFNTRICRPVSLSDAEREKIVAMMVDALGMQYDLQHVIDLARYFIRKPPVPQRMRRRMLAFGGGDPTRAICSTLIAQAFQSVRYPILPYIDWDAPDAEHDSFARRHHEREILHIRHHSLFVPRDFDLSPYFRVIKPTIEKGFDRDKLNLQ